MRDLIKIPDAITKSGIRDAADTIIDAVNNGEIDSMHVHLQVKVLEEMIKNIKLGIKESVLDAAEKHINDDNFPAKIELSQTGDRIDYEKDDEYSDIKKSLKKREEKLKLAYNENKKNGALIIDEKTGEVLPIVPAKTKSETIVKITFK